MMTSKDYATLLGQIETISDENNLKDYHAFTYWFIETSFGLEKQKILNSICDGTHDKGIDAILIDDIEKRIAVIQSKFEHKGENVQIKDSEVKLLATVRNYFKSRKALGAAVAKSNQVVTRLITDAFDAIHNKNYSLELVFITTHKNAPHLDELVYETFGFKREEFSIFHYGRIMELFTEKMRDFTPPLGPYHLPYKDADKSLIRTTDPKSWVLTVPIEEIRNMVNKFKDDLFRKNVRNFLGSNRCNKGIQQTLHDVPTDFWYYNNGITMLCDEATLNVENKYIRLVNPQIINGCQTVRSIEKFHGDVSGDLLVRVIESKDHNFVSAITLYQNTSNPVKKRDLKSNDPIQVRLKRELKLRGWYYEIKRGEEFSKMAKKYPAMKQQYSNVVNNEHVAKALAAIKLGPATAVARGSEDFFDDFYDELFTSRTSTYNCLAPVTVYWLIKNTYYGTKRFHIFKKALVFKNPAGYYVLRFIYSAFGSPASREKNYVSFYEDPEDKKWTPFFNNMKKVISEYFEIIYEAWRKSGQPDHRSYLQNSQTIKDIKKQYGKRIQSLSSQTQKAFKPSVI
jgi:hypothetical protein